MEPAPNPPAAQLCHQDAREMLASLQPLSVQLVLTSPPYNVGKSYESRVSMDEWLALQGEVLSLAVRALAPGGSVVWQVGNHVAQGQAGLAHLLPLDMALYPLLASLGLVIRNRVVWRVGHGLHARNRFSGRHEVALWLTRDEPYHFDLDAVRVPQKYPNKKAFRGPRAGQLSGHPLGKNPEDVWDLAPVADEQLDSALSEAHQTLLNLSPRSPLWEIPNVKSNHPEKTLHPAQFPVELAERFILSLTRPGDLVVDPFAGVCSTGVACVLRGRRFVGSELQASYVEVGRERLRLATSGDLRVRPLGQAIYSAP